ncbi:MAG: hypothetical protein ABI091_18635 [Ferruginibacter sp.]
MGFFYDNASNENRKYCARNNNAISFVTERMRLTKGTNSQMRCILGKVRSTLQREALAIKETTMR